jgi:hypothetical protein
MKNTARNNKIAEQYRQLKNEIQIQQKINNIAPSNYGIL